MMRRICAVVLGLVSASTPSWADGAKGGPAAPTNVNPGGCPILCSNYEACIEHRCVETCRPGCQPGAYCTADAECLPLPQPKEAILTEADRQLISGAESSDSKVLLLLNVGGVIGFGVQPGMEFGKKHSFIVRAQLMNTGLMTHAAYEENEFLRFEWGFGASAAYRYYEADWGNLRGFYYGGGVDYRITQVTARADPTSDEVVQTLAPFGEFGYRWVFGNFALGFGPTLAFRFPIASDVGKLNSEVCDVNADCEDVGASRFEGTMNVEIGWFQ